MYLSSFSDETNLIRQPSPRRAAYCIPHGPPPQLFVFKIATNVSTSASSYVTQPSHTTGELFSSHFDLHIINPLITMANNEEMFVNAFQDFFSILSSFNLADMFSYVIQWPDELMGADTLTIAV